MIILPNFRSGSFVLTYTAMDWGPRGFQLWMGTNDSVQLINLIHSTEVQGRVFSQLFFLSSSEFALSCSDDRCRPGLSESIHLCRSDRCEQCTPSDLADLQTPAQLLIHQWTDTRKLLANLCFYSFLAHNHRF